MSIATYALAAASIADAKREDHKKVASKRIYTAVRDANVAPEPR